MLKSKMENKLNNLFLLIVSLHCTCTCAHEHNSVQLMSDDRLEKLSHDLATLASNLAHNPTAENDYYLSFCPPCDLNDHAAAKPVMDFCVLAGSLLPDSGITRASCGIRMLKATKLPPQESLQRDYLTALKEIVGGWQTIDLKEHFQLLPQAPDLGNLRKQLAYHDLTKNKDLSRYRCYIKWLDPAPDATYWKMRVLESACNLDVPLRDISLMGKVCVWMRLTPSIS